MLAKKVLRKPPVAEVVFLIPPGIFDFPLSLQPGVYNIGRHVNGYIHFTRQPFRTEILDIFTMDEGIANATPNEDQRINAFP